MTKRKTSEREQKREKALEATPHEKVEVPNRYTGPKRNPDAPIIVHPQFTGRDEHGRFLPGTNRNDGIPAIVLEKKKALLAAATCEMVQEALLDLYNLAKNTQDEWVKVSAWKEFFDRVVGKPQKEIIVDKNVSTTTTTVNLAAISQADLDTIEQVLLKAQTPVIEGQVVNG